MNLFVTAYDVDQRVGTAKAIRDAAHLLGNEITIREAARLMEEVGDHPVCIGIADDEGHIQQAEAALAEVGAHSARDLTAEEIEEGPDDVDAVLATEEAGAERDQFSYEAAKVALVLMAAADGNPSAALAAAQAHVRVMTNSAIHRQAAAILLDTFTAGGPEAV